MVSRRDFGKMALAGLPLSAACRAAASSVVNGVELGVATYSFRDLVRTPGRDNVDDLIKALQFAGVQEIELSSANTEPRDRTAVPPFLRRLRHILHRLPPQRPTEVAAAKLAVRNACGDGGSPLLPKATKHSARNFKPRNRPLCLSRGLR